MLGHLHSSQTGRLEEHVCADLEQEAESQIHSSTLQVLGNCPGLKAGKWMLKLKLGLGVSTVAHQETPEMCYFRDCTDLLSRTVPVLEVLQLNCKTG